MNGDSPVRRAAVALAAPALAHQWARQESAPHGAIVVADREIAARGRGGAEWTEQHAIACSLILRPVDLAPSAAEVTWLLGGLAGMSALDRLTDAVPGDRPSALWWPDQVVARRSAPAEVTPTAIGIQADSVLGPGRVSYAIVTLRLGWAIAIENGIRDSVTDICTEALRHLSHDLNDASAVAGRYRRRCATLGHPVSVHRSPHGSVRGVAHDVTENGALVLRSPTGLDEVITVARTRSVVPLDVPATVNPESEAEDRGRPGDRRRRS